MKKSRAISLLVAAILLSAISFGQTKKPATDYLSVPGPIIFEKKSYNLSWSSHPTDYLYKQEYIVKGDIPDKYKTMILLDLIPGEANVNNVMAAKVTELKKMKEGNPIVNYESFGNPKTGEYMIDFILSANTPDGQISILERNVYRYKAITVNGQKAVLLFGVSERSYGDDADRYLKTLKANKSLLVSAVSSFAIPVIKIIK